MLCVVLPLISGTGRSFVFVAFNWIFDVIIYELYINHMKRDAKNQDSDNSFRKKRVLEGK